MGGGKEFPPLLPDPDRYVVEFTGEEDPMHPHNWPIGTKYVFFYVYSHGWVYVCLCEEEGLMGVLVVMM